MAETKVARRYAKSLLDLGVERNIADQVHADMILVHTSIRGSRELAQFFKSPVINTDKKENVLKELFGGKVQSVTLDFFLIITRKKREYYIADIAQSFLELYDIYKGRQVAWLTTAVPADDQIRKQMLDLIAKNTSQQVVLKEKVDPSILGGFILRWGDRQLDTSVTRKLHALKQDFNNNLYVKDF
ncbi:MAG: ATP synthase F1 subunit delta [Bacteroidota bacterium]|jgi:F-type H+-transporting ATPase subunit delta